MDRLNSMTGFGAARGETDWGNWSVEAKSVNGRSLDVRVNTPPGFDALEPIAKAAAAAHFKRGNIQIAIRVEPAEGSANAQINEALLDQLISVAEERSESLMGSANHDTIAQLLNVRGVVETGAMDTRALARDAAVMTALQAGASEAIDALAAAREAEGRAQTDLFAGLLAEFRSALSQAQAAASAQPAALKARLETQLADIGAADKVDADRLAAEVALSVAKADVREEVDRLTAHFDAAEALLKAGSPAGRKLDFLSQEIGREANTLCSKSASLELTNAGLALKALNDQFKEQAANVE